MILSMKSIVLGHINICTLTHTQPAICDQALFSYFLFVYLFSLPMSFVIGFVTRLRRRLSLEEQELLTLPEHLSSPLVLVGFVLLSLQFYVYVLQIVVLLYFYFWPLCCRFFFFWPLCCRFFFDIRILITRLVSSNSSCLLGWGILCLPTNICILLLFSKQHPKILKAKLQKQCYLYWQTTSHKCIPRPVVSIS